MNNNLKSCPFCGSPAEFTSIDKEFVRCSKGLQCPTEAMSFAFEDWQCRPESGNAASKIIQAEYNKAKNKHPEFPANPAEALCIIAEELGELAQAINDKEEKTRLIEEAAHVAVTATRFIEENLK
jgi:hypothetical protein